MSGKAVRLGRILNRETGTTVIVPMDHGPEGWWQPLEDIRTLVRDSVKGGADAILLRRGPAKLLADEYAGKAGLVLRVGCAPSIRSDPIPFEALTSSVEEAVRLGADAIAYTSFLGAGREPESSRNFGILSDACDEWGMPLVGEVLLLKGPTVPTPYDAEQIRIAARYAADEGADMVKVNYTGDTESFRKVVKYCPVPTIIAGGESGGSDRDVLKMIEDAMKAGAKGICIGRNIWNRKNTCMMVKAAASIVKNNLTAEEALKILSR
jgi:fructose-bisphosphate aldolase/2-amino-3,7-dideoxy-D-threo-hept-6-ulosonate synthase